MHWDGGNLKADVQLSYYWNNVNNGIRWLPDEQGLSRPLNIEVITARGVESDIALGFRHAQFSGVLKSGVYQVIAHMDKERYNGDSALKSNFVTLRNGSLNTIYISDIKHCSSCYPILM